MSVTLDDTAAEVNIKITQGDFWTHTFKIGTTAASVFTPWNLTGWTGHSQIRLKNADSSPIQATMTVVIANQSSDTGQFSVSLSEVDSTALPKKEMFWDLELVEPNGDRRTYMAGTFNTQREQTRV